MLEKLEESSTKADVSDCEVFRFGDFQAKDKKNNLLKFGPYSLQ
jgi:hypothetical protein